MWARRWGGPSQRGCTKSLRKTRTGFPTGLGSLRPLREVEVKWGSPTPAAAASPSLSCAAWITSTHASSFLPHGPGNGWSPTQSFLLRFTQAWGTWGVPMPRAGGPGTTYLLCFPFNRANYPCNCPPKREKGVQDPWQLLLCSHAAGLQHSSLACRGVAAAGFCLRPSVLVLYTVDVEQHFSLCFSRPVPLHSSQFLLLGSPCLFLNDV